MDICNNIVEIDLKIYFIMKYALKWCVNYTTFPNIHAAFHAWFYIVSLGYEKSGTSCMKLSYSWDSYTFMLGLSSL